MTKLSDERPPVGDKHEVAEFPPAVEEVCEPTFWHHWAAIVITAWPIEDAPSSSDPSIGMLLAEVANSLDPLFFGRKVCHAPSNVANCVLESLWGFRVNTTKSWCILWGNFAVAKSLSLDLVSERRGEPEGKASLSASKHCWIG